jgi:hypothetical protein
MLPDPELLKHPSNMKIARTEKSLAFLKMYLVCDHLLLV